MQLSGAGTSILLVNELRSSLDSFFSLASRSNGMDSSKAMEFQTIPMLEHEMILGWDVDKTKSAPVVRPVTAAIGTVSLHHADEAMIKDSITDYIV